MHPINDAVITTVAVAFHLPSTALFLLRFLLIFLIFFSVCLVGASSVPLPNLFFRIHRSMGVSYKDSKQQQATFVGVRIFTFRCVMCVMPIQNIILYGCCCLCDTHSIIYI